MSDHRWYAVQSQPHREQIAVRHLLRQEFEVFLPSYAKTVRHARRMTTRQAAFFPGYLFVRLALGHQRWRSINGTVGVRSLVTLGEHPVPLPKGLVEALIASSADGSVRPPDTLAVGDKVRLFTGPFAGLVGTIWHMSSTERVGVLLDLIHSNVKVNLHREQVIAMR